MPTAISYPNGKIPRSQPSPAVPSSSWLRLKVVPDRLGSIAHIPPRGVRGIQWELNPHKARGTWPVLREGGEEAIFIALA